jgi:hypothetical protein
VGTFLDDAPVLHADDAVAIAHGRQTMGDDDHCSATDDLTHVAKDDALTFIVEALVASSRINIGGFVAKARAIARRCLCPPERLAPRSLLGSPQNSRYRLKTTRIDCVSRCCCIQCPYPHLAIFGGLFAVDI